MKFILKLAFVLLSFGFVSQNVSATILINEFLADPSTGITGDSNQDGIISSRDDEFIEIVNFGNENIDISGWIVADKVLSRHIFASGTLLFPYECILVFGGGNPTGFQVKTATASSGQLHLTNTGDTISLFDAYHGLVDQIIYGTEADKNQSLSRFPDGAESFMLHSQIPEAEGRLYSAGTRIDGKPFGPPVVAEPWTLLLFGYGVAGFILQRKKSHL